MNQKALGEKLKRLREKSGLTQEEVEMAIGLPQKAFTHIENGARKISTLELAKMSELFRIPVSDFFSKEAQEEDLLVTLHRIAPGLESDSKVHDQVVKCIQIFREGVLLKDLLGLSHKRTLRTYFCPLPSDVQEAKKQGEEVAREERKSLALGDSPIHDIAEVLALQGIWTAQNKLPHEMSGLFLHHPSLGTAIIVNASHVCTRRCFSYAHEYAHALFDANRTIAISNLDNAGDLIEIRANAFASAFLMPEQGIANLLRSMGKGEGGRVDLAIYDASTESAVVAKYRQTATSQKISPQGIAWIAHYFGVSYQAAVYRLQNLGYFKAKERDQLLKEESKGRDYLRVLFLQDHETIEQASQNRELKAQIAYLVIEAFQRNEISRGRLLDLSKLLQLPGKELLQLAEAGKLA